MQSNIRLKRGSSGSVSIVGLEAPKTDPYPNLERICRLCLEEGSGVVNIFNSNDIYQHLAYKIMACVLLQVKISDSLPKLICRNCRIQLERFYYFQKKCAKSDRKLRKHIRNLNIGKKSKVFDKQHHDEDINDDDDDDDDDELAESREFLNKIDEEEKKKRNEEQIEIEKNLKERFRVEETERIFDEAKSFLNSRANEHHLKTESSKQIILNQIELPNLNQIGNKIVSHATESPVVTNDIDDPFTTIFEVVAGDDEKCFMKDNEQGFKYYLMQNPDDEESDQDMAIVSETVSIQDESENRHEKEIENENDNDNEIDDDNEIYNDNEIDNENDIKNEDDNENEKVHEIGNESEIEYQNGNESEIEYQNENDEEMNESSPTETIDLMNEYFDDATSNDCDLEENEFIEEKEPVADDEPNKYDVEQDLADAIQKTLAAHDGKISGNVKFKVEKVLNDVTHVKVTTEEGEIIMMELRDTVKKITRKNEGMNLFKCDACPQSFTRRALLLRHASVHVKSKGYSCKFCEKWFACKSSMDRHVRVHTGEKPFECDVCNRRFIQKEILKRHMITHTGNRPHKCPHCDRAYVQKQLLRQHINAKHSENPVILMHKCFICTKSFCHASGLSRHLLVHSGVIYNCEICNKKFSDKSAVRRHTITVHGSTTIIAKDRPKTETLKKGNV